MHIQYLNAGRREYMHLIIGISFLFGIILLIPVVFLKLNSIQYICAHSKAVGSENLLRIFQAFARISFSLSLFLTGCSRTSSPRHVETWRDIRFYR